MLIEVLLKSFLRYLIYLRINMLIILCDVDITLQYEKVQGTLQKSMPSIDRGYEYAKLEPSGYAFPLYASSRVHARKGFHPSLITWASTIFHQQSSAKYVFSSFSSVAASVSARNAPSYTPEYSAFVPPVFPVISSSAKRQRKRKWQHGHQLASEAGFCCRQHSSSTARW